MDYGRKEYRLFGLLLWSVDLLPYESDDVVEDDELPGDHQGGQFEFGFRDDSVIRLDPGLPPCPEA
jgi:hypothetical protein